jgi:hypothetical protein
VGCQRLARAVLLRALRDIVNEPNACNSRRDGKPAAVAAAISAQAFFFDQTPEARHWRQYWVAAAGLPPEALEHAYWWLHDHHAHVGLQWEPVMIAEPDRPSPCQFVLQAFDIGVQRCIALARPGTLYCAVHQPYPAEAKRRDERLRALLDQAVPRPVTRRPDEA